MSDPVIRVENLGKKYIIGHQQQAGYLTLREEIAKRFHSLRRQIFTPVGKSFYQSTKEEFWAVKDISFEVKQGEVVGIIGRNGAGKSTLLKILSRITEPTCGRVFLKGRVASLLEVGTGFHPELTGRENIFLNGAILGMTRQEITRKFDEIVAFSEVEKFIDTPVKRYSSGMYVRLAFAVAAHLEPEILIVDEVLAVGDAAFQKKCLGKMKDVSGEGRTVLFVSHNMGAIESLCQKGMLLHKGSINFLGSVQEALSKYASQNSGSTTGFVNFSGGTFQRRGAQIYASLKSLSLLDDEGNAAEILRMGQAACFRLEIEFKRTSLDLEICIGISNLYGVYIHFFVSNWEGLQVISETGVKTIEVKIPEIHLFPGEYQVFVWVKRQGEKADDAVHEALRFTVEEAKITPAHAYFKEYSHNTQVYAPSFWRFIS